MTIRWSMVLVMILFTGCGAEQPSEQAAQLSGVGIGAYFSMVDNKRYRSLVTKGDVLNAAGPQEDGIIVTVDETQAGELAQAYVDTMFADNGQERLTVSSTHYFPQSDKHYFYVVKFQAKNIASMVQVVVLSNGEVLPLESL